MEKEHKHEVTVTEVTHEFFCDECGKSLGITREFEDGYYPEKGRIDKLSRYFSEYGFEATLPKHHYCDECRNKVRDHLMAELTKLGFDCSYITSI